MEVLLKSTITCPKCGHKKEEDMPTTACQFFYDCENCKEVLKPKEGDCCVFCSYGTVACPPIQENNSCGNSNCSSETGSNDLKTHWDNAYEASSIDKLGWFEENPIPSLQLIKKSGINKNATILNVGAGATTLVDELIIQDYKNILVNDICLTALEKLKKRLGKQSENIKWIVDDLTNPTELNNLEKIDLWHDRAVLHFFSDTKEQDSYFNLLKKIVKEDGFVIIATFNLNGATICSGLPVHRYDEKMIQEKLGNGFELVESFDYTYTMPSKDTREYIYTLFRKK